MKLLKKSQAIVTSPYTCAVLTGAGFSLLGLLIVSGLHNLPGTGWDIPASLNLTSDFNEHLQQLELVRAATFLRLCHVLFDPASTYLLVPIIIFAGIAKFAQEFPQYRASRIAVSFLRFFALGIWMVSAFGILLWFFLAPMQTLAAYFVHLPMFIINTIGFCMFSGAIPFASLAMALFMEFFGSDRRADGRNWRHRTYELYGDEVSTSNDLNPYLALTSLPISALVQEGTGVAITIGDACQAGDWETIQVFHTEKQVM